MTADNTSSEFALLTYAHHIVDMLANSTDQRTNYPSTNHFKYFRTQPIFAPAGTGALWSASFHYQSQSGYLWSSSVYSSSLACDQSIGRSRQYPQFAHYPRHGFTLRCVAGKCSWNF